MASAVVSNSDHDRIKSIFSGNDSFTRHEPCPKCHSRDNLARYKSGSAWCFGCGYFERGGIVHASTQQAVEPVRDKSIPDDCDNFYGVKVLRWIGQYGLTPIDLIKHNVLWSPSREQLIYPFYGASKDELVFWQARNFRDGTTHKRRFFTGGLSNEVVARYEASDGSRTAIVVEDCISALKMTLAGYDGVPCFSSNMPKEKLQRVCCMYDKVIIWLDDDKFREATNMSNQCKLMGTVSRVVHTPKDPKFYSLEDIEVYCGD